MKTFNAYYRVAARKNGGTAAEWKTTDSIEAFKFFKYYADTYRESNEMFIKTNTNENPYIITLDVVDADSEMFVEIKREEV